MVTSRIQIPAKMMTAGNVGPPPDDDPSYDPSSTVVIDVAAKELIDVIVKEELASLSAATPDEQDEALASLLQRVERRAVDEIALGSNDEDVAAEASGYQFGDITKSVVEATRGEVQRQMDADWNMNDISLLLKVGVFLGAGAAAPISGLAAMPAAALLATYGTVLKAELGVRAVQEVGVRLQERAVQGIADGVRSYTGKESYSFGDVTEATVHKVTGNEEYRFGDLTRGALKSVTGKEEYKFGDLSRALFRKLGKGEEGEEEKRRKR